MMNINLVPKIPKIHKWLIPLLVLIGAVSMLVAGALVAYHYDLQQGLSGKALAAEQLNANVRELSQQRTVDPVTVEYNKFLKEIQQLRSQRYDWVPVFGLLTSQLPETSRLLTVQYNMEAAANSSQAGGAVPTPYVSLKGEFASLEQSIEYIVRLQQSPLVERVDIEDITRTVVPAVPAAESNPGSPSAAPGTYATSAPTTGGNELNAWVTKPVSTIVIKYSVALKITMKNAAASK